MQQINLQILLFGASTAKPQKGHEDGENALLFLAKETSPRFSSKVPPYPVFCRGPDL